jgi:hypothetical protein
MQIIIAGIDESTRAIIIVLPTPRFSMIFWLSK